MKYIAAFLIVLGLGIIAGSETHDWMPMFMAQIGLGVATTLFGYLFATQVDE